MQAISSFTEICSFVERKLIKVVIIRRKTLKKLCLDLLPCYSNWFTRQHALLKYNLKLMKTPIIFELFFCKKKPFSRRVGYVMDGSMGQWVSEWVSERVNEWVTDVCMSHQSDWIYYKQPIKFLFFKFQEVIWHSCFSQGSKFNLHWRIVTTFSH